MSDETKAPDAPKTPSQPATPAAQPTKQENASKPKTGFGRRPQEYEAPAKK